MKVHTVYENSWKVEFIYSPLFEMLCSLHVLVNPEHHLERIKWAQEMKAKIDSGFYEEILELSKLTDNWCVIMDLCNIYEACDDFNIMEALSFLEDIAVENFNGVLRKYDNLKDVKLDESLKIKIVTCMKEYYLFYFHKELRFIEPLLVRSLNRNYDTCISMGLLEYINELHSRIEITDSAFLFHKFKLYTIPYESLDKLIVRVSSFISPHLLMDYGDGMVQFTITVHLDKRAEDVPVDLLRLMKALSDETRLKIVRQLRKAKSSTQSLAIELNITEAGISKHLKILFDAELLYKERIGNYIYYYLNTRVIDYIPLALYEYIEN